jgi:putative membrane protein
LEISTAVGRGARARRAMSRWTIGVAVALVVGLGLTVAAILHVGVGSVWHAVERIGPAGFALFCAYNLIGFLPVGWAWWAVAPGAGPNRWLVFPWGRLARESASDVLPFSQVGGLVVGSGAVRRRGVSEPLAIASQIVDLTTEMASQLFYTLFGVAMLVAILSHVTAARDLLWTVAAAFAAGAVGLAAFVALQGRGLDMIGAIGSRWLKDTRERTDAIKAVLHEIYAQPGRVLAGGLLHGVGWVWSGAGSWLALKLMGVDVALWKVLTMESLIAAVKSVAFLTPGALGFQEGAYVLIAPLFGLTAEATLAVSLLRRAKDLVLGAPAVLVWQYLELTAKRRLGPTPAPSA